MPPVNVMQRASRWFGAGVVTTPLVDIANDRGILQALGTLDPSLLLAIPAVAWLHVSLFIVVGIASAWLMVRLDRRWRGILFWGCALCLFGYALTTGLTVSVVAGALVLCFAYVQLRFASDLEV